MSGNHAPFISKYLLLITFILTVFVFDRSTFAQGLSGHINLLYTTSETTEDGRKTADDDKFNQNLYLDLNKLITPNLSYRLYLRESLTDSESTDSTGGITTQNTRSLEPALDFFLRNSMYTLTAGYRRQEEWSTASLKNESRETNVFYYSRFNITPKTFPSLSINFDRQENFDHVSPQTIDSSVDDFSINSRYALPSEDLKLDYYVSYSHTVNKDPLSQTEKTIKDNVSANYNTGYSGFLWNRKTRYTVNYQGNYTRDKTRQFLTQTGSILSERAALGGLYIQDIDNQVALNALTSLVDDDLAASTGINLSTGTDHQIGIFVSSSESVDRMYIYVNTDVSGESNLNLKDPLNWSILRSDFNIANTWSPVSISSVEVRTDISNNLFWYELSFASPQNASYFKAINNATSSVLNVEVTEVEAYGTDTFSSTENLDVNTTFIQLITASAHIDPIERVNITLNYSVDRSDRNPVSVVNSIEGVFENLFNSSISNEKTDFQSFVTRNYGISATWLTHTFLTTTLSFQKSENFDNLGLSEFESDTYRLLFYSAPLPTLDMTLSLIKSDSFSFDEKTSTTDSVLLSINSDLYYDVDLITDFGYTESESLTTDTITKSHTVSASLDARVTKNLTGTLNYAYNRTTSDNAATDFMESLFILNYRPGRYVNITGNFKYSDSDGILTFTEGVSLDWRPLRAIRITFNYEHSDSEPDPSRIDTLNGLIVWYLTKFADLRFNYSYVQQVRDVRTETHNYKTSLNARF